MQILDDLRREHDRIDAVLGALRTWADRLRDGIPKTSTGVAALHMRGQLECTLLIRGS